MVLCMYLLYTSLTLLTFNLACFLRSSTRPAKSDNYDAASAVGRVSMEGGGEAGGLPKGEDVDGGGRWVMCSETLYVFFTL